jgi:hypothetical protein
MCPIFDSTKIASLFDKRWKCQGISLLYVCGLLRMETRSRQYARLSYSIYYGVKTTYYYVLSLNEGLLRYFPIFRERTVEGQTEKPCRTRFSRRLQEILGGIKLGLEITIIWIAVAN